MVMLMCLFVDPPLLTHLGVPWMLQQILGKQKGLWWSWKCLWHYSLSLTLVLKFLVLWTQTWRKLKPCYRLSDSFIKTWHFLGETAGSWEGAQVESLGLEKSSKIHESNLWLSTTLPTKPQHRGPCPVLSWAHPGTVTPPVPWEAFPTFNHTCSDCVQTGTIQSHSLLCFTCYLEKRLTPISSQVL